MDTNSILADIDRVLRRSPTCSDRAGGEKQERSMSYLSCIERWAPASSPYVRQARSLAGDRQTMVQAHLFEAILHSLRADIQAGALRSFEEIVHADLFADLLAQAEHLNGAGYALPAAVIAGASLEEHLRQLAGRHGVSTKDAKGDPRTASALNSDLYSQANTYGKAEHAQVDAWQKTRNMAAHGDPAFATTYRTVDITRMIDGIRDFIVKHPA